MVVKRVWRKVAEMKPSKMAHKQTIARGGWGLQGPLLKPGSFCHATNHHRLPFRRGALIFVVGEWDGDTGTADFTSSLLQNFKLQKRVALPNWSDTAHELTVWSRVNPEKASTDDKIHQKVRMVLWSLFQSQEPKTSATTFLSVGWRCVQPGKSSGAQIRLDKSNSIACTFLTHSL